MHCEVIYLDEEELNGPRPLSWNELQSMKDLAAHYMQHGTKQERRLAFRLGQAAAWIEAEAKEIGQKYEGVLHIETTA